jgi:hypothetical protein
MSNVKKLMMQAAGGGPLNVENVFNTFLYNGNGGNASYVNGIDFAGEGGLAWFYRRTVPSLSQSNFLVDTVQGGTKYLTASTTLPLYNDNSLVTSFNSDGFTLGNTLANTSGDNVTWSWRIAPKFFDVQTYTGNGSTKTINHNLGSVPGFIIIKRTDANLYNFACWHRGTDSHFAAGGVTTLRLNSNGQGYTGYDYGSNLNLNESQPTASSIEVKELSYEGGAVNGNGGTYVAYLFAHNNSDGEFGPNGDLDIIKCGAYTGTGSTEQDIDLGFQPQWLMVKGVTDNNTSWNVWDDMRGWRFDDATHAAGYNRINFDQASGYEYAGSNYSAVALTNNGFKQTKNESWYNASGKTYVYMAIRKGPTAVPENASDVFAADKSPNSNSPRFISGFKVDIGMQRRRGSSGVYGYDLNNRYMDQDFHRTGSTNGDNGTSTMNYDFMNGYDNDGDGSSDFIGYMWRESPEFCAVSGYKGTGSARTVAHTLQKVPEMIWVKNRDQTISWSVYHSALGNTKQASLNANTAPSTGVSFWNNTTPTSSVFTVGTAGSTNSNTRNYIAYLFCSLDGIAKVGSYTGNGSNQNIECGFSNGAKLIILKNIDRAEDWLVFDAERGIVSGNDPALRLNVEHAEITNADAIDPYSGGFNVVQNNNAETNQNNDVYIFYAVAA